MHVRATLARKAFQILQLSWHTIKSARVSQCHSRETFRIFGSARNQLQMFIRSVSAIFITRNQNGLRFASIRAVDSPHRGRRALCCSAAGVLPRLLQLLHQLVDLQVERQTGPSDRPNSAGSGQLMPLARPSYWAHFATAGRSPILALIWLKDDTRTLSRVFP